MRKTVYIETSSTNPAFNLALEQYVFDVLPADRTYFWLWQNDNAVIVGKHQNTVEEINQAYVREHGIRVVRRLSGGGAVYHDLGNVNFTFIADAGNIERLNLQAFCVPVVETLKSAGVFAQLSGRNDITVDGRKFSGNSQYLKNGRILHHGTLMFDSDLSAVAKALQAPAAKYESKGFSSVRSRVVNIRPYLAADMETGQFMEMLKDRMLTGKKPKLYRPGERDLEAILRLQRERYDTWEWNYGASPRYSVRKKRRFEGCGELAVYLQVEKGRIAAFQSFGDYFGDGATEALAGRLQGCPLKLEELGKALEGFNLDACYRNLKTEEFLSLLLE